MTTIRTMMIIAILGSLVYSNAQAMEEANNLPSIDLIPVDYFSVHTEHAFKQLVTYGNNVHVYPGISPLYWYRMPTCSTITPEDVQRNFTATKKINSIILEELGYSKEDLQKYEVRVVNGFNKRLKHILPKEISDNYSVE